MRKCAWHPTCRPGRPRCSRHRSSCSCPAYHYPHRPNSGRCGREDEARNAEMMVWAWETETERALILSWLADQSREDRMQLGIEYRPTHPMSLAELEALPTLCVGQADDLKVEINGYRVWLSRMTADDGAPCPNEVTVELWGGDDNGWQEDPLTPPYEAT